MSSVRSRSGRSGSPVEEPSTASCADSCTVLMITILMLQLQSFQRLFLVVATGPLAVIGGRQRDRDHGEPALSSRHGDPRNQIPIGSDGASQQICRAAEKVRHILKIDNRCRSKHLSVRRETPTWGT